MRSPSCDIRTDFLKHQPSKAPDFRNNALNYSSFYVADQTMFTTLPANPNDNFPNSGTDKALVSAIGVLPLPLPILSQGRTAKISIDLEKDSSVRACNLLSLKFACRNQLLLGDFVEKSKPKSCSVKISCKSAHTGCDLKTPPAKTDTATTEGNDGPDHFAVSKTELWDLTAANFQEVTECTFQTTLEGGKGALLIDDVDLTLVLCEETAGTFAPGCPVASA